MAGIFLAKRTTTTIYRASILEKDHGLPGPFFFSTAYDRAQFAADTAKEGVRKATEVVDSVGDTAKKTLDGAWRTAKDANQMVRDTVNSNGNEIDEDGIIDNQFVDEILNIDGPVDTVEYRNMEDNFDELKNQDEAN